jgi:hypothetical protein
MEFPYFYFGDHQTLIDFMQLCLFHPAPDQFPILIQNAPLEERSEEILRAPDLENEE